MSSSEQKDYEIFQIRHLAVKSQKRIIEKGKTGNWEDIENKSKFEPRIISIDKIEIKTTYEEKLLEETKTNDNIIQKYKRFKIVKKYHNNIEQKDKEKKELIHTKTITKKKIFETTEKKPFNSNNGLNMEFCEEIIREETLIEFDDGTNPIRKSDEINRKKRYFKISNFEGEPYDERIDYTIYTKVKKYQREDETDENGEKIIKKGYDIEKGDKIINTRIERHVIGQRNEDDSEREVHYEYREIERNIRNSDAQIAGILIAGVGFVLNRVNPILGYIAFSGGTIISGVSSFFKSKTVTIKQRKRKIITKHYLIIYNKFNDHTEEVYSKRLINIEKNEGDWEDF